MSLSLKIQCLFGRFAHQSYMCNLRDGTKKRPGVVPIPTEQARRSKTHVPERNGSYFRRDAVYSRADSED